MVARSPLRIGALACSSIARRQILPVLASDERFVLCGVASRSREKAVAFAREFGTRPYTYDELLADESVEAVYVSVPVGLHFRWGQAALEAGKHLLIEKTVTGDLASAEALIELGRGRGLVTMEALAYVYHPLFEVIGRVAGGESLGSLRYVEAHFHIPARPPDDIRLDAALGGGALLDLAVYPLSFCLELLGSLPRQCDLVSKQDEGMRVDCRGFAQLAWPGCAAHLSYGFGLPYRNQIGLYGASGCLLAERIFTRPPAQTDGVVQVRGDSREEVPIPAANAYAQMLVHFYGRVRGLQSPGINEGQNLLGRMQLIDGLREAIAANEHVD